MESIQQKVKKLPIHLQKEVDDFVEFLLNKSPSHKKKLSLSWYGGLKEFRNQYTSLELQKKASDWRD